MEERMLRWKSLAFVTIFVAVSALPVVAQSQQQQQARNTQQDQQQDQPQQQDVESGQQGAAPQAAPVIGARGSRFLVTLETRISTKQDKAGKAFLARTVDPITTDDGDLLPPGTAIRGHIVKVRPADTMDKARLWLAFDEIHTPHGWAPLAAGLIDMPDVQKLRVLFDHEGAIEYAPVKREDEILAALAAAMSGAAPGVAAKNSKDAATGAAEAAGEAFMATSGMGQEIKLEQNTTLQLALARPIRMRRA
jgi:hypothetical protein